MKNQKALKITEIALVVSSVLFVILKNLWSGFEYFALGTLALVMIGAIALSILGYIQTNKELKEEYGEYLLEKYRNQQITKEQLEQKDQSLYKHYLKENAWERYRYLAFAIVCAAIVITTIVSIF